MKSKIAIALVSAGTLIGLSTAAFAAHPSGGGINARQDRQENRIERGINSGELTRYEVRKLRSEQRDIAELERCLRQYGGRGLQSMERRVLQRLLNVASKNIRNLKHNNKRVYAKRRNKSNHHRSSSRNDYGYGQGVTQQRSHRRSKFSWLRNR